jgi:hypothetical protein
MGSEADPASLPAPSSAIAPLPISPATEEQLIGLWLHGKSLAGVVRPAVGRHGHSVDLVVVAGEGVHPRGRSRAPTP